MGLDAGGVSGGGSSSPYAQNTSGMKVARQTTLRPKARSAPSPAVSNYTPPAPPVVSNSSGQYVSGGGAPSAPSGGGQGPIQGPGSGPSRADVIAQREAARQERIQARQQARREHRQDVRKDYYDKAKQFRSYLGSDETLQSQMSTFKKELEDYILSNKDQRGDVREDFSLAQQRMGDERTRALEQLQEDFAARGLLNSGLFADAVGEYDTDYQTKLGDLARDRDRNLETLLEQLGMYRNTNRNERQNAKAAAIERRAAQFNGWDPSQKPKFMQ